MAKCTLNNLVKEDLGCASDIVGCINAGVCTVVDHRLDMVEDILALALGELAVVGFDQVSRTYPLLPARAASPGARSLTATGT